jgi:hypothetical protein
LLGVSSKTVQNFSHHSFIYFKMVLLDNDAFLTELTKLFTNTKEVGSVFINMKRCKLWKSNKFNNIADEPKNTEAKDEHKGVHHNKKEMKKEAAEGECKCLLRATDGKKVKFSTLVCNIQAIKWFYNFLMSN